MSSSRPSTALLSYGGLFLVALALRLLGISLQNIWYDEHWTLLVASAPITELPQLLPVAESSKPPLYFAFMHYWLQLGGGEFWLRLPSAIFGALDCVAAAALGRQFFGWRVGVWLGWLLALAPFQIYYSQEARPYTLWSFLMSMTLLLHLKFCAKPQRSFLVGYVVLGLLACYTFVYSIFVVAFSLCLIFLYRPVLSRENRSQMAWANLIIALLYLPWLWKVTESMIAGVGFLPVHNRPLYAAAAYTLFSFAFGMSAGPTLEKLRPLGAGIFREAPFGGAMLIFGSVLFLALVGYGLFVLWRTNRNAFHFSALGIVYFWFTAALLNFFNPEVPLNARYAFPTLLPLLVLIFAACLGALKTRRWLLLLPIFFSLTIATSLANHYFNPQYARDDLRAAARFLRELDPPAEEVVLCAGHLVDVFRYYYGAEGPVAPLSLIASAPVEDSLGPLEPRLAQVRRFALVYSRPDHGDPDGILPGALQARYRLQEHHHWTGVDVYVLENLNLTTR